jgi:hypothetical protein
LLFFVLFAFFFCLFSFVVPPGTSNCGNPSLRLFGFGPVVPDGFGIGYIIKDTSISFCLTSKHRQGARMRSVLQSYLNTIKTLLQEIPELTVESGPAASPPAGGGGDAAAAVASTKRKSPTPEGAADDDEGYSYFGLPLSMQ